MLQNSRRAALLAAVIVVLFAPQAEAALPDGPLRAGGSKADLVVASVGRAPATLRSNQELRIAAAVRNRGAQKSGRSAVRFYLSHDARRDAQDVRVDGVLALKGLKPRKAARGSARLKAPGSLTDGTYRLLACADDLASVRERNERNNCRAAAGDVRVGDGSAPVSGPPTPPASPPPADGPGTTDPGTPPPPPNDAPPAQPNQPTPLDKGATTPLDEAVAFIYKGAGAIQQGVAPGTISEKRIAVLRGRVLDADGKPLENVRVTVLDHGEYGHTWTRADGHFDMVVNGARLDVVYAKDGYLPVQREIDAPWQDYLSVEDAVMIRPDAQVTTIDPASAAPFQVARGSAGGGGTPATLLFAQGTHATLEMPDGSTRPAPGMSVRATEFPAGSQKTLPGTMPGNVGPTYAVEFTLDEAIAAGAESVSFDKPVINYTDNFIQAPVGGAVPTAYYDRGEGEWIPAPNGRVIAITGESDGKALVDADETPGPDTPESLAALGMTDAERAKLAELYEPGVELWRVPIKHFTPWDHNSPYGPPPGSEPPKLKEFEWKDPNDPCNRRGSIIACESQTLGEEIPVTGTGLSLRYDSSRQPGYRVSRLLDIPITDASLPAKLQGIELSLDVAGRHITKRWCDPTSPVMGEITCAGSDLIVPNIRYRYEWDGTDAWGREVTGRPYATIKVTYIYELTLYSSSTEFKSSFGAFPSSDYEVLNGAWYCGNVNPARDPVQSRWMQFYCGILTSQTVQRALGAWDAGDVDGLGGLSISPHHGYDPNERVVYRGDGGIIRTEPLGATTRTLAGQTDYLTEVAAGPDGSVYWHSGANQNRIWRVTPSGERQLVGGKARGTTNADRGDPTGDGGPAVDAVLGNESIGGMDVAPDGSLYFTVEGADAVAGYVRRIRPDGIIETIAGVPWSNTIPVGENFDGGPAKQARLGGLEGLDVAPDGSIYFGERDARSNGFKNLLRRITPDGTITTIAGGGTDVAPDNEDLGAGEPARQQNLSRVYGVAAAEDGSVYISDPVSKVVQRIGTDGNITRVAGNHTLGIGYGLTGADAPIGEPTDLSIGRGSSLYVRTNDFSSPGSDVKLLRVDLASGLVAHIAGRRTNSNCEFCTSLDDEQAGATNIESNSYGIVVLPDGRIVYGDGRYQVRVVEPTLPGYGSETIMVPSPDASEVYVFSEHGRHLRTLDAVTGAKRWEFTYDGAKRLVALTDGDGRTTRIERAADGSPVAIVAPGGARTTLTLGAAGRVAGVANPAGEATELTYGANGLLSTFALPGRPPSKFDYDPDGRLVRDESPTGAVQTLARTETPASTTVDVTSGEGRVTSYVAEALPSGDRRRAIVQPSGATVELLVKTDGSRVKTDPDGTRTTMTFEPDERWGMRAPVPSTQVVETPSGRKLTTSTQRDVLLADPSNPLSVQTLTTRVSRAVTGRATRTETSTYSASTKTVTRDTSTGKHTTAKLDASGRVVELDPDGPFANALAPVQTTYDTAGHVSRIAQGAQSWTFAFDARDRVSSRTDAKGRVVTFDYDAADRIVRKTFPGGREFRYAWRADGALQSLTMPSGAVYGYGADDLQRPVSLALPGAAASYGRALDKDGAVELMSFPSGAARDATFNGAGLETATDYGPERDVLGYPAANGQPDRIDRTPDGGSTQTLSLVQDGFLPKVHEFTGPAAGRFTYAFDDFLDLTSVKLESGADTVTTAYAYDNDGRATTQGPFTLTRFGPGGLVSAVADGTLAATLGYDSLGRLNKRSLSAGGAVRYSNDVSYGSAGQVESRTEKVGATTRTLAYEYDANGRLVKVRDGGAVVEAYDYDANGNRIHRTLGNGPQETSSYDAQDRITQRGATNYDVDADGFLSVRGGATFDYSASGALLSAHVGGATIGYAYDGLGRRVTRTEAAGTTEYLYGNPANPFLVTATRAPGGELTTYFHDEEGTLYAFERGGVRYYVGADQVGSPRVVFKGDGTVVKEISYDAFGGVTADSDPAFELPFGFAGGLADGATGLVRFGLRDYDPASGRFTARDPIFFSGSPTNLYAYANSDPASLRDPTGMWCIGGSFYSALGGGIQYCRKNGQNSICAEGGVGVGGGVEIDPFGGAAETGTTMQAEITQKYGPVSGTLGVELDLDCFNAKGSLKLGTATGHGVGIDTNGDFSHTYGGSGLEDFNGDGVRTKSGSFGFKTEGKLVLKGCGRF